MDSDQVPIPLETMSDMLKIVLGKNYFAFAGEMYHQKHMAELEENLFTDWPIQPLLWLRFIDDILAIWLSSAQSWTQFVDYLNTRHPTIKFTSAHSVHSVDFLDLTIHKGERFAREGVLDVKPFLSRPTNFNICSTIFPTSEKHLEVYLKQNSPDC